MQKIKLVFLLYFLAVSIICRKKKASKDYYEILGVHKRANKKQIKKAYRKLVKKYHPDNNKDRANWAKKQFIEVTKAYETLSDPEKRKIYDMGGEEAVNQAEQREN